MLISEVIAELTKLKDEFGDIPVHSGTDGNTGCEIQQVFYECDDEDQPDTPKIVVMDL